MNTAKKRIVVLGSLNYDVFLKVARMPVMGETMAASDDIVKAFGGKGANQAVGCARLVDKTNTEVIMLGQIGSDQEGKQYLEYLQQEGIGHELVKVLPNSVTGQAFILSNTTTRDNCILIIGGANQQYSLSELAEDWQAVIRGADILLMQREVPDQVNLMAAKVAKESGCKVVLDLGGPLTKVDERLLELVDVLSPNQVEFNTLVESVLGSNVDNSDTTSSIHKIMDKYPQMTLLFK